MEDRSFPERALEIAKGIFHSGQQNVDAASLLGVEILAIRFEQIGAIHEERLCLSLSLLLPTQFPRAGVKAEPVIPSHTGIALLQTANGLIDLRLRDPLLGDSRLEPTEIGQQAFLLLLANRLIFGLASFASTQNVELVGGFESLDPNPRLFLRRIARRGFPQDFLPSLLLLEFLEPRQALRLSAGDHVVMAAGLDLLEVLVECHAAVHNHRASALASCTLLQGLQHLIDGRPILTIAVEDLMGLGKAFPIEHQADDDLFAVRSLIA